MRLLKGNVELKDVLVWCYINLNKELIKKSIGVTVKTFRVSTSQPPVACRRAVDENFDQVGCV